MKLKNKKTGEIINSKELLTNEFLIDIFSKDFNYFNSKINKIQEEWEDYEEPKEYWYIEEDGDVIEMTYLEDDEFDQERRQIGNYFETQEEAEKAVEKLKAWKRLRDNGFRFKGWRTADLGADKYYFVITAESDSADKGDLDLLFGGEE